MITRKRDLSDVIRLFENVNNVKLPKKSLLIESKETRTKAISVLQSKNVENPQDVLSQFTQMDKTKNELLLPVMAYFYGTQFGDAFIKINKLIERNMVRPPSLTKTGVVFENNTYTEFLSFQEAVDGIYEVKIGDEKLTTPVKTDLERTTDKPIFDANGIVIYDANDKDKCIMYGQGGVTGRQYSFCISSWMASQNMWQSYRDTKTSTFYFVVDNNRDFEKDPLHIVVVDKNKFGTELTDANNWTGDIAEYGKDPEGYMKYLRSKGVNTEEIFKQKPKTPQELEDDRIVGKPTDDFNYFKKLSYEYKYKYIGRGHQLTDQQFDYLWNNRNGKGAETLLMKYFSTGIPLNEYQFNKIAEEGD